MNFRTHQAAIMSLPAGTRQIDETWVKGELVAETLKTPSGIIYLLKRTRTGSWNVKEQAR